MQHGCHDSSLFGLLDKFVISIFASYDIKARVFVSLQTFLLILQKTPKISRPGIVYFSIRYFEIHLWFEIFNLKTWILNLLLSGIRWARAVYKQWWNLCRITWYQLLVVIFISTSFFNIQFKWTNHLDGIYSIH